MTGEQKIIFRKFVSGKKRNCTLKSIKQRNLRRLRSVQAVRPHRGGALPHRAGVHRNSLIGLEKMLRDQESNPPAPPVKAPASATPAAAENRYSGVVSSTVKYLLRTEVHTFAFSVAANALLSFFPFVLLLMTLIRRVFRSPVMYDVVVQLLRDFLPAGQDFVIRNLNALVGARNQRPGGFVGNSPGDLDRNFHAARGGIEPHLAVPQ